MSEDKMVLRDRPEPSAGERRTKAVASLKIQLAELRRKTTSGGKQATTDAASVGRSQQRVSEALEELRAVHSSAIAFVDPDADSTVKLIAEFDSFEEKVIDAQATAKIYLAALDQSQASTSQDHSGSTEVYQPEGQCADAVTSDKMAAQITCVNTADNDHERDLGDADITDVNADFDVHLNDSDVDTNTAIDTEIDALRKQLDAIKQQRSTEQRRQQEAREARRQALELASQRRAEADALRAQIEREQLELQRLCRRRPAAAEGRMTDSDSEGHSGVCTSKQPSANQARAPRRHETSTLPVESSRHDSNKDSGVRASDAIGNRSLRLSARSQRDVSPAHSEHSTRGSSFDVEELVEAICRAQGTGKGDLPTYDGTAVDHVPFFHDFEAIVHTKYQDPRKRLALLIRQCRGRALAAIKAYRVLPPSEGYELARKRLDRLFGKSHVVAASIVKKITEGKTLAMNDISGIQDLAILTDEAAVIIKASQYPGSIDSADTIRAVLRRLPVKMRDGWLDHTLAILESGREPRFADINEYVQNIAERMGSAYAADCYDVKPKTEYERQPSHSDRNDGRGQGRRRRGNGDGYQHQQATMLATNTNSSNVPNQNTEQVRRPYKCTLCGGACLFLNQCQEFKAKSLTERQQYLNKEQRCYNCLKKGHTAAKCPKDSFCRVSDCTKKHHQVMHHFTPDSAVSNATVAASQAATSCFLGVVPVAVECEGKICHTYALLDDGSQHSLCSKRLLEVMKVEGKPANYTITGINGSPQNYTGRQVNMVVRAIDGTELVRVDEAWVMPTLPQVQEALATTADLARWRHLSDLSLTKIPNATVTLIIGADVPQAHWPMEMRRGRYNEPYAIKSALGWAVRGPRPLIAGSTAMVSFVQVQNHELSRQLKNLYETEFNEPHDEQTAWSIEDGQAMKQMRDTLTTADCGRFELGLPWRRFDVKMPPSRTMAEGRLASLKKKLSRNEEMHQKYTDAIEDYIAQGHAELADHDSQQHSKKEWYLPHHGVVSAAKPDKLRVVFDAAARSCGTALNDELLQGPDLVNDLTGVLMKFRRGQIALTADIKQMFHQVRVRAADRDALKFLWWPGGNLRREAQVFRMCVHVFGARSSPSCAAFALRSTADELEKKYPPAIAVAVRENFYVDDCLASTDTSKQAVELITGLNSMLSARGFELTKWIATAADVMARIPQARRAKEVAQYQFGDELPQGRALGLAWNIEDDTFQFNVKSSGTALTRRGVLSDVSSLFDPLGLVAPVLLPARAMLQEMCDGMKWDEPLPPELAQRWVEWRQQLTALHQVNISRRYTTHPISTAVNLQLHVFTDASESGYGAVAYLRASFEDGGVQCSLIMGKSRVAPRKVTTLPRLELQAAVVGAKLASHVRRLLGLNLHCVQFWTDAMIVLGFLRNVKRRFKTYVANRVATILEQSSADQWRHVPGKVNPADIASRGIAPDDFAALKTWLHGPVFLTEAPEDWPADASVMPNLEDCGEIKQEASVLSTTISTTRIDWLMDRVSCMKRMRRVTGWIMRFCSVVRTRASNRRGQTTAAEVDDELRVEELQAAEKALIRYVQMREYVAEWRLLAAGKSVQPTSRIAPLNPIMQGDVIRVGGRLHDAPLEDSKRHPVIMPEKSRLTRAMIREVHEDNGHVGCDHVLNTLQTTYWIPRGKATVKSTLRECRMCRCYRPRHCEQQMAPLIREQVTPDLPPFTFVGVDCFGPLLIKCRRTRLKRWGCLFTCLTVRAVHLEVLHGMTADSLISAFQRFRCRRGDPDRMFSDRGTNLIGAEREMREALEELDYSKLTAPFAKTGTDWVFNPPVASHRGGATERMIRSVRQVLCTTVKAQVLTDEQLLTVFAEAERCVNSRPLTSVSSDVDSMRALTPSMLLTLKTHEVAMPPGIFDNDDNYARRWWRQAQFIAEVFWRRWIREYLATLQERQRWKSVKPSLKVGDIVLMDNPGVPRCQWPLARITKVHDSRDGHVRSVDLVTGSGRAFTRPVTRLCLLEVDDVDTQEAESNQRNVDTP